MQANRAEVRTLTAADLPDLDPARLGLKGSPTKVKKTFVPPVHSTGVRVEGKDAGEYAITGTASNTNYNVAFVNGTYTITDLLDIHEAMTLFSVNKEIVTEYERQKSAQEAKNKRI